MNEAHIEEYLQEKLKTVPLENFVRNFRVNGLSESGATSVVKEEEEA
jgi:hypothetical protein